MLSIIENLKLEEKHFESVGGKRCLYQVRDETVPVLDLVDGWRLDVDSGKEENSHLVIVESTGSKIGLRVNELLDQQQVVIKSLETHFRPVTGISGATILGDGSVALILDIQGLANQYQNQTDSGVFHHRNSTLNFANT